MNHYESQSVNTTQVGFVTTLTVTMLGYRRQGLTAPRKDKRVGKEYTYQALGHRN